MVFDSSFLNMKLTNFNTAGEAIAGEIVRRMREMQAEYNTRTMDRLLLTRDENEWLKKNCVTESFMPRPMDSIMGIPVEVCVDKFQVIERLMENALGKTPLKLGFICDGKVRISSEVASCTT